MDCPCCKMSMVKRSGKFGEFFYCKNHGTMSVQNGKLVATGKIKLKLSSQVRKLKLSEISTGFQNQPKLSEQMEMQMMFFGVRMTETDCFIEGETLELMQLNAQDDEDHWLNTRPY